MSIPGVSIKIHHCASKNQSHLKDKKKLEWLSKARKGLYNSRFLILSPNFGHANDYFRLILLQYLSDFSTSVWYPHYPHYPHYPQCLDPKEENNSCSGRDCGVDSTPCGTKNK